MRLNPLILATTALALVLLVGCEKKLPEVNDENCKSENIAKLDKNMQQELSSKCLRVGT